MEQRHIGTMVHICDIRRTSLIFQPCRDSRVAILQVWLSFIAAHLVRSLAKYAAGSGISEIKCILAGFVIKGFLGFGTFFIKSITLVSPSRTFWSGNH